MSPRRTRGRSGRTTPPSPEQQSAVDDVFRNIVAIVEAARAAGGARSRPSPKQSRPHRNNGAAKKIPSLSAVIGEATSEDAQLKALAASLNGSLQLPVDGFVVGEPVEVTAIEYDGNTRRGLTAVCRRRDGLHTVSLADVSFSPGPAASAVALYREWLGMETAAEVPQSSGSSRRRHKAEQNEIELGRPVDLIVLACKSNALRCRLPGTERELTLRTAVRDEVPGEIITVAPAKSWKLGHTREAAGVFRRMLRLNPSDNQGARFNLAAVADGRTWEEMEEADA